MTPDLGGLEESLGYRFQDRGLLIRALTHSSSANETRAVEEHLDNERLEFLGDSVLGWIVSEKLFRSFGDFSEGQLSLLKNHIVSATHLLLAAHRLDLGIYLQLGRGEETAGGRSKQRILVNAFEAVLAAVYLDGGLEAARTVVERFAMPQMEEMQQIAGSGPPHDFRAELERLSRDRNLPRPQYLLVNESGPGHSRIYRIEVRMGRDIAVSAEGTSKKAAAHNAAREVCRLLRGEEPVALPAA